MFRLPFVMPQSGDAPPGVEESKFDTEGLKGVGKGGGRTGNRPQLWGDLQVTPKKSRGQNCLSSV